MCASRFNTHPNFNVVLDLRLLLVRVVAVRAHELWLQDVARSSVEVEEGAVELGVFVCANTYSLCEPLLYMCPTTNNGVTDSYVNNNEQQHN